MAKGITVNKIHTLREVYELYLLEDAPIISRELDGLNKVLWRGLLLVRVPLLALSFSRSTQKLFGVFKRLWLFQLGVFEQYIIEVRA